MTKVLAINIWGNISKPLNAEKTYWNQASFIYSQEPTPCYNKTNLENIFLPVFTETLSKNDRSKVVSMRKFGPTASTFFSWISCFCSWRTPLHTNLTEKNMAILANIAWNWSCGGKSYHGQCPLDRFWANWAHGRNLTKTNGHDLGTLFLTLVSARSNRKAVFQTGVVSTPV